MYVMPSFFLFFFLRLRLQLLLLLLLQISRNGDLEDVHLSPDVFRVTVVLGSGGKNTLHPVQATAACYHTQQVLAEVLTPGQTIEVSRSSSSNLMAVKRVF